MPATDKFKYDLNRLHLVFAVSCVAILVATVLMMVKDHNDEWRNYQKTGFRLEAAAQAAELTQLETDELQQRREDLEEKIDAAQAKIDSSADELTSAQGEVDDLAFQANVLTRRLRAENADRDVARANYDIGVRDNLPAEKLDALRLEFDTLKAKRDATELELQTADKSLTAARGKLAAFTSEKKELLTEQKKLTSDIERISKAMEKIAPEGILQSAKRSFMEWPIIDGFNSHLKITQDWLPDLHQTLGMTETARFDRCRTCHMMIDRTAAGMAGEIVPASVSRLTERGGSPFA